LRNDAGNAVTKARIADTVWHQNSELCGNARTCLILQNARTQNVLQKDSPVGKSRGSRSRQWRFKPALKNRFPVLGKSVIENNIWCDEYFLPRNTFSSGGLQLDFHFVNIGNGCVRTVEGWVRKSWICT